MLFPKVVRNPGRVKIRRKVTLGDQAEKVLAVAEEENIDLVVLAVRQRSFFPYLMARGKLLRMISRLPCPVLLKPSFDESCSTSGVIGGWILAR
jgi:nucleotide-binding universal stress UspA family protein